ncbi:MAG: P-II family nitrogen regulator [Gammaproteobacteria bacterium]|nr:MAG: P-II family nitrogen regulator [Gammaproteobacteria bacterium]
MPFRKVTAIIRPDVLKEVEERLIDLGVPGVSVTRVKGFGEHASFYSPDWLMTHVRIEVFIERGRAREIAEAIMDTAHSGREGDGIVAILPVETLFHVRTRRECDQEACE